MNTLIKPPCTNGRPEDRLPIINSEVSTPKPCWIVLNAHLLEDKMASWADVRIINPEKDIEIWYSDVCDAVRGYNPDMGARDIDEFAEQIVSHFIDNPMEQKDFDTIVAEYAAPSYKGYNTKEECEETAFSLLTSYAKQFKAQIDTNILRSKASELAIEMMNIAVEDRFEYIDEAAEEFIHNC